MPQQAKGGGDGDGAGQEVAAEAEKKVVPETIQQQAWDDLVSTGLSFINKLGQTLLGQEGQTILRSAYPAVGAAKAGTTKDEPQQLASKAFSGLKIETDKATGQRHLKLPIPKKEILEGIANLLNEFSKKI